MIPAQEENAVLPRELIVDTLLRTDRYLHSLVDPNEVRQLAIEGQLFKNTIYPS